MTREPHTDTEKKLDHVPERLIDEFPDVPEEPVERDVRAVADRLARRAKFTDFVPLLVHRFVRERLLDLGARRDRTVSR